MGSLNPIHERKLRSNWTFLKNELAVEDLSDKLVEEGTFSEQTKYEILHVQPNTRFMKAEKFLQFLVESGDKGYDNFCNLLRRESDNMYKDVIEKLEISTDNEKEKSNDKTNEKKSEKDTQDTPKPGTKPPASHARGSIIKQASLAHRSIPEQTAKNNNQLSQLLNSTNGIVLSSDVKKTNPVNSDGISSNQTIGHGTQPTNTNGQSTSNLTERSSPDGSSRTNTTVADDKMAAHAIGAAGSQGHDASGLSFSIADNAFTVHMNDLEQELVRMAPQIAELLQKISRSNPAVKATKDQLQELKGENDQLRKANRSLVEKLNIFQQKIIQLQLENKRLRDNGLHSKADIVDLINRAQELSQLEKKLTEQKRELDEKEKELNEHLRKIEDIERENEQQKQQIKQLELLHEVNVIERTKQKVQISELKVDKERHQRQIEYMEELQRREEERFLRLEHRLRLLEQASMPRYRPNGDKEKRRPSRVMSPPKAMPWMSGVVNRSHHANVKFTPPETKENREALAPTEKGWAL